jgi:hypothetical protein
MNRQSSCRPFANPSHACDEGLNGDRRWRVHPKEGGLAEEVRVGTLVWRGLTEDPTSRGTTTSPRTLASGVSASPGCRQAGLPRHATTPARQRQRPRRYWSQRHPQATPGARHSCACYKLGVTRSCPRASRRWGRNLCAWFPTSVELLPNSNRFRSLDTNQFCTVVLLIEVDWLWDLVCERGEIGDGLNIWPRECGVSAWQYWFLLFALGFHTLLFAANDILIPLNITIFLAP